MIMARIHVYIYILVLTMNDVIVAMEMTTYRPKYESERKAPKIGKKLETALHMNKMLVALAAPKLYTVIKYNIIFG